MQVDWLIKWIIYLHLIVQLRNARYQRKLRLTLRCFTFQSFMVQIKSTYNQPLTTPHKATTHEYTLIKMSFGTQKNGSGISLSIRSDVQSASCNSCCKVEDRNGTNYEAELLQHWRFFKWTNYLPQHYHKLYNSITELLNNTLCGSFEYIRTNDRTGRM